MRLRQLCDRRGQVIAQIRALSDAAGNNALTAEQQTEYDRLFDEQRALAEQITREEQLVEAERELQGAAFRGGQGQPGTGEGRGASGASGAGAESGAGGAGGLSDDELRALDEELELSDEAVAATAVAQHRSRRAGHRSMRREQLRSLFREQRTNPRAAPAYRAAFRQWLRGGMAAVGADGVRALQAGTGAEGGFLTAPMQMAAGMIKAADNLVFLRQLATVETVPTAGSLGVVSLDADPDDGDWTVELGTGSEDAAMAFGRRQMTPHPVAKRIKISNRLLAQAAGVEGLVQRRLAYKFAVTEEKAFLLGDGQAKPLGVFTASNDGVPTSRDVSAGNTTTAITYDGLVAAKYAIKAGYRRNAGWLFHRDAIKNLLLIKDSAGLPIWQPSITDGTPDRLLGHPMYESEYVPNTFTTGLYVGMFADFSYYWIVDALAMQFQRLVELYAETNQTGIICRRELDGQPVLGEAFARVKLA